MTFYVTSSRAHIRGGMGRASPLSLTDLSQPSLNERMVRAGAALMISYLNIGCTAPCDRDVDINIERKKE